MVEEPSERLAAEGRSLSSGAAVPASGVEPASSARAGAAATRASVARSGSRQERIEAGDPSHKGQPDQAAPPPSLLSQLRAVPNILSLARLAAVPFFVAVLARGHDLVALAIFAAAAVTDGLDGLFARLLNQRTPLGAVLDPIADKLLTLSALATLVLAGRLPWWLLGLVVARDGAMALAVLVLRLERRSFEAMPTRLGKYATFLLAVTMVLAMLRGLAGGAPLARWVTASALVAAECVVASLVQYFARWRRWMRAPQP